MAAEVIAAALGGAVSSAALFPLEVLKTKMQVDATKFEKKNQQQEQSSRRHMMDFAVDLYRKEGGISVFYRGWNCSALQSALEKALYFFFYTTFQRAHRKLLLQQRDVNNNNSQTSFSSSTTTTTNLVLGYLAEWAHLPLSLPLDAWTTAIQTTTSSSSSSSSNQPQAPLQILLTMLTDQTNKNQFSFYKGLSAYFLLCWKPALQYAVYEKLKAIWLRRRHRKPSDDTKKTSSSLSALQAFWFGVVARAVATVVVFPFLRTKVILQAQQQQQFCKDVLQEASVDGRTTAQSMRSVLWRQWELEGLSGLYRGLAPELTRGALSAAIMLAIKERLAECIQGLMIREGSSLRDSISKNDMAV